MIELFKDDPGERVSAHREFQRWRSRHPNGFFLNVKSRKDVKLHRALCTHSGDVHWIPSRNRGGSLTQRPKICSTSVRELMDYALKEFRAPAAPCEDCKPDEGAALNANSDWTEEELRAAVEAYVDMQKRTESGERFRKRDYYKVLAAKFGRSEKAFEFRMCNISSVLASQGKPWIRGLLPRKNVGDRVARQIEGLLATPGTYEAVVPDSEDGDDALEERIRRRKDIGATEKLNLVRSRRGQGVYRANLEQVESCCRLTGLLDRRHLRASHIKPWCVCTDAEKLDGFNGLLLSPHVDHLFDRGYISFTDQGDLMVSKDLNPLVLERWGILLPRNVGTFRPEQRRYLDYHRGQVFEKTEGGRRRPTAHELEVLETGEPAVVKAAE